MKKIDRLRLYEMRKKSPTTAVLLSFLITGVGSMYAGKVGKGVLILFIQMFLWIFLMGWIMWIIAPIIAYQDALDFNTQLGIELEIDSE